MDKFEGSGFFNIFKPVGMTSHDVVAWVRRELGRPKTGHAGTLDPAACGVLVVLVNRATKLSAQAMGQIKRYRAEMTFGIATDSGDAQGYITAEKPAPVDEAALRAALEKFTGPILQVPPMTSAIKIDGKKLYEIAHKGGEDIVRPPREVTIHTLELIDLDPQPEHPRAVIDVRCSSGTYIRTLVQDIACSLGLIAHTSFLMRSEVGPFTADCAVQLEDITAESAAGLLLPPDFIESDDAL